MPAQARGPAVVVVVGVSGSGKSTVGGLLARRLRVPFLEGDDLHSAANRAKMAAGRPLDDADRGPWLDSLADWIREADASGRGGVVACSALKHAYRERLRAANPGVWFLYLRVEPAIAVRRVAHRAGHFMPARLVAPSTPISNRCGRTSPDCPWTRPPTRCPWPTARRGP